jgi:hypothetical protein
LGNSQVVLASAGPNPAVLAGDAALHREWRVEEQTMNIKLLRVAVGATVWISLGSTARSADFNGAWATDASVCGKVFTKAGGAISFSPYSDEFGGGFVIEGNRVRGQQQNCTIKSRKDDGNIVHMIAACSSDIMTSNVQFSAKIIDADTISRFFPGMPDELAISYSRCKM